MMTFREKVFKTFFRETTAKSAIFKILFFLKKV